MQQTLRSSNHSLIELLNDIPAMLGYTVDSPQYANAKQIVDNATDLDRLLPVLYLRWCTRRNAKSAGIAYLQKSDAMTDETKAWLSSQGLGGVTDWEFLGVVDHGSQDAGCTCSHGNHRLRYAYYAGAKDTNGKDVELCFGRTCGSEFFQIDLGTLNQWDEITRRARVEFMQSLVIGRASAATFHSFEFGMMHILQRSTDIAVACYRIIGRTQMELWLSFMKAGIIPPHSLRMAVRDGYKHAVFEVLSASSLSSAAIAIASELQSIENEFKQLDTAMRDNPGVTTCGEFIHPLTSCTLFDAIRATIAEEILDPSPISAYWDTPAMFAKINQLEEKTKALLLENPDLGTPLANRTLVIHDFFAKAKLMPFSDEVSCLRWACIRNDLRYITLFFGLTANATDTANAALHTMDEEAEEANYTGIFSVKNFFDECWLESDADAKTINTSLYFSPSRGKRRLLVLLFAEYYDELMKTMTKADTVDALSYCLHANSRWAAIESGDIKLPDGLFGLKIQDSALDSLSDIDDSSDDIDFDDPEELEQGIEDADEYEDYEDEEEYEDPEDNEDDTSVNNVFDAFVNAVGASPAVDNSYEELLKIGFAALSLVCNTLCDASMSAQQLFDTVRSEVAEIPMGVLITLATQKADTVSAPKKDLSEAVNQLVDWLLETDMFDDTDTLIAALGTDYDTYITLLGGDE